MNTLDAIRLRRSIRKFRPEAVPTALLREIVEVSRLYPSGGNLQPIRFAVVTDRELTDAISPSCAGPCICRVIPSQKMNALLHI